jgi:hypothetical protein
VVGLTRVFRHGRENTRARRGCAKEKWSPSCSYWRAG